MRHVLPGAGRSTRCREDRYLVEAFELAALILEQRWNDSRLVRAEGSNGYRLGMQASWADVVGCERAATNNANRQIAPPCFPAHLHPVSSSQNHAPTSGLSTIWLRVEIPSRRRLQMPCLFDLAQHVYAIPETPRRRRPHPPGSFVSFRRGPSVHTRRTRPSYHRRYTPITVLTLCTHTPMHAAGHGGAREAELVSEGCAQARSRGKAQLPASTGAYSPVMGLEHEPPQLLEHAPIAGLNPPAPPAVESSRQFEHGYESHEAAG